MHLKRVSILGVGLLGGSVGLAAKSRINNCEVVGYGHRRQTLDRAIDMGAIDRAEEDPASAVKDCDLVILCTPVSIFEPLLKAIAPHLAAGAIVTDVGSTKRSIVALAEAILPKGTHFIGSHPMAGSEKRGIDYAKTDLFQNSLCILTPTARTDAATLSTIEQFWQTLGMRLTHLSPAEHDRLLADISHLPHAIAATLLAIQSEEALGLAGKGFLDTTRIASGDANLWRDIFLDNRDNLKASLAHLRRQLGELESLLDPAHAQELAKWLDRWARRREELLLEKLREASPD